MTSLDPRRVGAAALPVLAIGAMVLFVGATLAVAGDTLGFDFLAYHVAMRRLLEGQQVYDMSFEAVKGWGLFYYPPAFIPLVLPFGFLGATVATWLFVALSLVAFVIGVAILPVSRSVRWWIVLLAGLSWPFVYAIKLGQVGPILFLTFAAAWRWLDDPVRFGFAGALGAAIKIQPGILFGWALLTRRWRHIVVGTIVLAALSILAIAIAGVSAWGDFLTLARRLADPIDTERNLTPGAVLFRLGVPYGVAVVMQLASMGIVVGLVIFAAVRATAEASFMVAVTASQLLSPILWDHYAMLLLLPVAYLLSAGARWAVVIPLVTATPFVTITPPAAYPILFFVTLIATLAFGLRRPEPASVPRASFA